MENVLKQEKSKSHKEFERLLTQDLSTRRFVEGEIVEGIIEEIGKKHIWVDLGLKSSGAVPIEEFKLGGKLDSISVGTKVDVLLEKLENRQGEIVISFEKGKRLKGWKQMEQSFANQEEVTGTIISRVKGGYAVSVNSCICFLPQSQLSTRPIKVDSIMKIPQTFLCVKLDKRRGNIVLSRRAIVEKLREKDREKDMKGLKEKMILKNCVCKSIQSWGAFFSYGSLDLLVHINEISWSRVSAPSDLLQIGQICDVFLHKIEGGRLSGSLKRLQPDPFIEAAKKYKPGDIVKNAIVHSIAEYGAFVNIEANLCGLVHNSCLDHLNRNIHPSKVVSVSEKVSVKILSLDANERKLSLSIKDCIPNPWLEFKKKYKKGSTVNCKIKQKNDYGIFCIIEDTPIVGMLHVSNLSWDDSKGEEQLKQYHKGDILKCQIYLVDSDKMRVQLSKKHLEDDPFEIAFANKKVSDIVTAVVQSHALNGIYVTVGKKNLSILIKKNNLAVDLENQRGSRFKKGDKIDCMITELTRGAEKRKVLLSIKALEEKDLERKIKKYGSKDSGGVLGEILGPLLNKKKEKDKKK